MSHPTSPEEILHALNDLYVSRLLTGVACTICFYDWILVLSTEMETIYKSRWTLAKGLFYYIRLITPPGLIVGAYQQSNVRGALSKGFCTFWMMFAVFGMLSSLFASNALFALRLIALYKRKTYVVWFIYAFFFASYAATLGIVIDSLVTYGGSVFYDASVGVCTSNGKSNTIPAIFYAPSAFEAFVFALTVYRAMKDAKLLSGAARAPFLTVLYRDGITSFVIMVGMRIWNVWIYSTQPLSSFNMGTPLMWAVNTVLTTRVYMNLVWLAKKPLIIASQQQDFSSDVATGGGIRMRVHTFTEVHTDTWKPTTFEGGVYSVPSPHLEAPPRTYTSFTP